MINDQAIRQLIRSLRSQQEGAHRDAHTMKPKSGEWTGDEMWHQGYQSGRAEMADSVINTLEMALVTSAARQVGPCSCECNRGGFCGGCGHAGCGGRR